MTPCNILDALKDISMINLMVLIILPQKHFVFAHSRIHALLSLSFSAFLYSRLATIKYVHKTLSCPNY